MNTATRPSDTAILQDFDPNELVAAVEEVGLDWADANGAADLLEETRKTVLAQLQQEYQRAAAADGKKTLAMNQVEMMAQADPRYQAHLETMIKARTNANRLRVRYDSGRVKIELMRSVQATRREELRQSGFRT